LLVTSFVGLGDLQTQLLILLLKVLLLLVFIWNSLFSWNWNFFAESV